MNPAPTGNQPIHEPASHPGGVDIRTPPLPPAAVSGGGWASRSLAGIAVLAAALTTGHPPTPPQRQTPLLIAEVHDCGVPTPTPAGDLAVTARTPTPTSLRSGRPARPVLLDLALQVTPAACDHSGGWYDVVHHRAWHLGDGGQQTTRDVVRWYADDDSGVELITRYPEPRAGVTRDFWPPGWLHDKYLFHAYRSTDWLRTQARVQTTQTDEATVLLAGLAVLATWYSPRPPQRALAARVLADTAGLTTHPGTIDRAGRSGIGVAAISHDGHERHLLTLHPATGEVLAYERAGLTPTGWRTNTYLLLLTHSHAPHRWWEPPPDTPPPPPQQQRMMPRHCDVWLTPPPTVLHH